MDSVIDFIYSLRLFQGRWDRYRHQHFGRFHEHHHCYIDAPDFVERHRRSRRNASCIVHGNPRNPSPGRAGCRLAGLHSAAIPSGARGSRASFQTRERGLRQGSPFHIKKARRSGSFKLFALQVKNYSSARASLYSSTVAIYSSIMSSLESKWAKIFSRCSLENTVLSWREACPL